MKRATGSVLCLIMLLSIVAYIGCTTNAEGGKKHSCSKGQRDQCVNDCHEQYQYQADFFEHNECVHDCFKDNDCDPGCEGHCHGECREAEDYAACFTACVDADCTVAAAQEECDTGDYYYGEPELSTEQGN